MKKLFTILTVVAFSTTMSFSQTEAGTFHIGGNIGDVAWTSWSVSPTVGYFVMDGLAVGTGFEMYSGDNAAMEGMSISPFVRYYLNDLVFANASLAMVMPKDGDTETAIAIGTGLSLMWNERVAIEPGIGLLSMEDYMGISMNLGISFRLGMDK